MDDLSESIICLKNCIIHEGDPQKVRAEVSYCSRNAIFFLVLSLVYMSGPNGSRTKCAYVWTELRNCTAPSANVWHTVRREPKFVSFLREHKEN